MSIILGVNNQGNWAAGTSYNPADIVTDTAVNKTFTTPVPITGDPANQAPHLDPRWYEWAGDEGTDPRESRYLHSHAGGTGGLPEDPLGLSHGGTAVAAATPQAALAALTGLWTTILHYSSNVTLGAGANGALVIVDATAGAVSVTLETAPADGYRVSVFKLDATVNQVQIATAGGDSVMAVGQHSETLINQGDLLTVAYDATDALYVATGLPLSLIQGATGGDVSGYLYNLTVTGLLGHALPAMAANGFIKANAAGNGWEVVGYGSAADTVMQGNTTLDAIPTAVADVSLGGHKITNLADGVAATDAATVGQLSAGGWIKAVVAVSATTYNATAGQNGTVFALTSGAANTILNLPTAPATPCLLGWYLNSGITNPVTINTGAGDTFDDGATTSITMLLEGEFQTVLYDATTKRWLHQAWHLLGAPLRLDTAVATDVGYSDAAGANGYASDSGHAHSIIPSYMGSFPTDLDQIGYLKGSGFREDFSGASLGAIWTAVGTETSHAVSASMLRVLYNGGSGVSMVGYRAAISGNVFSTSNYLLVAKLWMTTHFPTTGTAWRMAHLALMDSVGGKIAVIGTGRDNSSPVIAKTLYANYTSITGTVSNGIPFNEEAMYVGIWYDGVNYKFYTNQTGAAPFTWRRLYSVAAGSLGFTPDSFAVLVDNEGSGAPATGVYEYVWEMDPSLAMPDES